MARSRIPSGSSYLPLAINEVDMESFRTLIRFGEHHLDDVSVFGLGGEVKDRGTQSGPQMPTLVPAPRLGIRSCGAP